MPLDIEERTILAFFRVVVQPPAAELAHLSRSEQRAPPDIRWRFSHEPDPTNGHLPDLSFSTCFSASLCLAYCPVSRCSSLQCVRAKWEKKHTKQFMGAMRFLLKPCRPSADALKQRINEACVANRKVICKRVTLLRTEHALKNVIQGENQATLYLF